MHLRAVMKRTDQREGKHAYTGRIKDAQSMGDIPKTVRPTAANDGIRKVPDRALESRMTLLLRSPRCRIPAQQRLVFVNCCMWLGLGSTGVTRGAVRLHHLEGLTGHG